MFVKVENVGGQIQEGVLRVLFAPYGDVRSISFGEPALVGVSSRTAYIEMPDGAALRAIDGLQHSELEGQTLTLGRSAPPRIRFDRS